MRLIVPASVDVKSKVSGLNLSETLSKNLKYRIYYILSRIVVYDGNMKLYEDNDYYRKMCSENMKDIMSPRYYREVMNLLMNPNDPVIECNQSYQTGKYCKSYRLTDKYNTGEVEYRSLPDDLNMVNRIKEKIPSYREGMDMMKKYDFLIDQFDKHPLSVESSVYEYIFNMYLQLMERVVKDNKYQQMIIHNLIGRWLKKLNRLNEGDLKPMVSGKNHRLNSLLTQMPKNLRPWILCDGMPLIGVDVKASQPYLLASVMKDDFFSSSILGYNLKTIYPSLYQNLYNRNMFQGIRDTGYNRILSSTGSNSNYVINNTSTISNNNTSNTSNTSNMSNMSNMSNISNISNTSNTSNSSNSSNSSNISNISNSSNISNISNISNTTNNNNIEYFSFMWFQFFGPTEVKSIQEYQSIPFEQDYYSFIIKTNSETEITPEELEKKRISLKKSTMYFLFDGNQSRRMNNPQVKYMKQCYPGVNKWLELAHKLIDNKNLSYILQRSESYFLLNKVSRQFSHENPNAPIFTIHDCLYTHERYVDQLQTLISETGLELTGILPGLKIECSRIEITPSIEDVDNHWKRVKWVTNQKQFDKKKRGVFQSNIDRAFKFINSKN